MLLLFETAAGYALFKVLKENKLEQAGTVRYWILWACCQNGTRCLRSMLLTDWQPVCSSRLCCARRLTASMLQDYAEDFNTQESALKVSPQQPLRFLCSAMCADFFVFLSGVWVSYPCMLLADGQAQGFWQV